MFACFLKHIDETHSIMKPVCDDHKKSYDGIFKYTYLFSIVWLGGKVGLRSEAFHNYVIHNYGEADFYHIEKDELILLSSNDYNTK